MEIALIAAMDRQGVIGANGGMPWRLRDDLRRFKALTMGKPLIMGRKTHESIGRALPGRKNIVITRQRDYQAPGCVVAHDLEAALAACPRPGEVMVMGGGAVYEQLLPRAARLYLTQVDAEVAGDAWFPRFERGAWRQAERRDYPADEHNEYPCSLRILERERGA